MNKSIITAAIVSASVISGSSFAAPSFSLETGLILDKSNSNITLIGPRAGVSLNFDIGDRFTISPTMRVSRVSSTYRETDLDVRAFSFGITAKGMASEKVFLGAGILRNENRLSFSNHTWKYDTATFELEVGANITKNVSVSYRPSMQWYFQEQSNTTGFWAGADNSDAIDNIAHSLNVQYRF